MATKNISKVCQTLRESFNSGKTLPVEFRLSQLKKCEKMLEEGHEEILQALMKDLRKGEFEATVFELNQLKWELGNIIRNLRDWVKPTKLPINLLLPSDRAQIHPDPLGLVLVVGAFNYPFILPLLPFFGSIAAGNVAICKPSEISPNCSATLTKLVTKYLDQSCYRAIEGGIPETQELLSNKFDYIFATGSCRFGKIIYEAASKHLTPVSLELGGKSPAYVAEDADMQITAKRIVWGKFMNLSQTCIAPDYIICSKKAEDALLKEVVKILPKWFEKDDPKKSKSLGRIVSEGHWTRLTNMLNQSKGQIFTHPDLWPKKSPADKNDLWIPPTIILNVTKDDSLMSDEIFGPLLPIMRANTRQEALEFINSRPKPLALYVFTKDTDTQSFFNEKCSSGGYCINDCVYQHAYEGLPFGGVGDSGMGAYHGKATFDTFTHKKSVLIRDFSKFGEAATGIRYPPYTNSVGKMKFFATVLKNQRYFNLPQMSGWSFVRMIFAFVLGVYFSAYFTQSKM